MANIITLTRLLLLLPLVAMIYLASPSWQLATVPLLAVIIGMDGLDGYVARKRREVSVFGSIFDIAVDRVIEYVLWAVLGHVGLVPMWVALVFIIRGTFVDSIRYTAIAEGETAFGMMRSTLGRFLVESTKVPLVLCATHIAPCWSRATWISVTTRRQWADAWQDRNS